LYIAASSSINVTVTLTSPDSPGIYKLMALVNYIGGPDMAFDSFEVNNPSPPEISSGSASLNGGGPVNLTQKYNCNMSYILYENECCLDQNNDSICDKYETQKLKIQNKNQTENYNSSEQNSSQNNIFYESVKTLFSDISIIYQSFKDKIDYQILVSVILILIISILIIANRKIILNIFKIHRLLCIFLSKNKKYPINSLNDLIGKKIYSEDGNYVGNVIDVTLEENKIDSLKVKIDKNNPFGTRGIIIKYKHVIGVGEVVFIDESISKHI